MEVQIKQTINIILEGEDITTFQGLLEKISGKSSAAGYTRHKLDKEERELVEQLNIIFNPKEDV